MCIKTKRLCQVQSHPVNINTFVTLGQISGKRNRPRNETILRIVLKFLVDLACFESEEAIATSVLVTTTDLYIVPDAVPPIHAESSHVATDKDPSK